MNIKEYIETGILELYVLGEIGPSEQLEVEKMRENHPEVASEIKAIQETIEKLALENSMEPHPSLKPLMLATFNYINRLEHGEAFSIAPVLTKDSKIADFEQWINEENRVAPENFEEIHASIITATPEMTCAIVWIKNMAPDEVHHAEHERFLILEGTCTIVVGETENKLVPGDFFEIPLYEDHKVIVTSAIPCKVILQRIAA